MKIVKGYKKTALGKEKKQYLKIGENCIKIFFFSKVVEYNFQKYFQRIGSIKTKQIV